MNWNEVSGLYIFTYVSDQHVWEPVYIGQAKSLADRLSDHEKWPAAARLAATHIHARVEPVATTRGAREERLLEAYPTALNVQGQ